VSTVAALLAEGAAALAGAGIGNPRFEARLLLGAATGRTRARLAGLPTEAVAASDAAQYRAFVARRAAREPMAYVLGRAEFWSLRLAVGPGVLVPRPDTETLVEAATRAFPDRARALRVLDLGVGSGCLLLALLSELPEATGLGVDDSPAALALARRNAERLGLAGRADFRHGHWGESVRERFDLIVSNPPYVAERDWDALQPEIREFEPKAALVAGPDGLAAYRALAPECTRLLAQGGVCALEIGFAQGDAVAALLAAEGLAVAERRRDLAGIERCLVARS
jgi:release factor glutamine methyltransferase